jgi:hypothetical protein
MKANMLVVNPMKNAKPSGLQLELPKVAKTSLADLWGARCTKAITIAKKPRI